METPWKIAIAVRDDLPTWQKLNIAAFVTSGIAPSLPHLVGAEVPDASGQTYLPKLGLPILIYQGDGPGIRRAFDRALDRDLAVSVYTDDLFTTGNDTANRAAIASVATTDLVVAGFSAVGDAKQGQGPRQTQVPPMTLWPGASAPACPLLSRWIADQPAARSPRPY